MWKRISILVMASMLLTGTAMAHGGGQGKGRHQDDDKPKKAERCVPPGLENALKKVKNPKAKAAILQAIEKRKKECRDQGTAPAPQLTDTQRVEADKTALQIRFTGGDSASRVTGPVLLATRGAKGTAIAWSSDKPNVISATGAVTRPQGADATVVLTAQLHYNQATASKTFTVTVKAAPVTLTDQQRVSADAAALQIEFNGTDTASNVTQPPKTLASAGQNGSRILWFSSLPAVVSNDGKTVSRPANGTGDATVVMTAIVSYGSASEVKTFTLVVKQQLTDAQKVSADKEALAIDFGGSDTATRVTRPFDALPTVGANGSTIVWTSSAPSVVSNDGKTINRPALGTSDAIVSMTAFITNGTAADVKVFFLTVKQEFTSAEKLAADKADLAIGFAAGDSASSVTKPISLPAKGYYGSTIIWYSSAPSIISDNGAVVNRPLRSGQDATVTMLAYLNNNGVAEVKTFTLTVKKQP